MNTKKILTTFLTAILVSPFVFAHEKNEPFYKTDTIECSAWGYTNIIGGRGKDLNADVIRLRTNCNYENFSFFIENDIAGLVNSEVAKNYIIQAWASYNFGKDGLVGDLFSDTTIRAGSIVTAARLYLPATDDIIPVIGPNNPFHPYGYGIQIQTKITPNLLFVGDITGTTTPTFDDKERWKGTETSQRLVWDTSFKTETGKASLQLSLFHQWSDIADKIGVGVKYSPAKDLDFYGGAYYVNEKVKGENFGGYALAGYQLWEKEDRSLELRAMGMAEMKNNIKEQYTGFSVGFSLILPKDGGYQKIGGSSATVDFTNSSIKPNTGGIEINDSSVMTRIRLFF